MRKIVLFLFALIIACSCNEPAMAQEKGEFNFDGSEEAVKERLRSEPKNLMFGINLRFSIPRDDFDIIMNTPGVGFGIFGGYHLDPFPAALLLEYDYYSYGDESANPVEFYMPLNLIMRFQNSRGKILPYFEVIGNIGIMAGEDSGVEATSGYGLGTGIMFPAIESFVMPGFLDEKGSHLSIAFDMGFRYMWGSLIDSEFDVFMNTDFNQSNTHQISISFGFCLFLP